MREGNNATITELLNEMFLLVKLAIRKCTVIFAFTTTNKVDTEETKYKNIKYLNIESFRVDTSKDISKLSLDKALEKKKILTRNHKANV